MLGPKTQSKSSCKTFLGTEGKGDWQQSAWIYQSQVMTDQPRCLLWQKDCTWGAVDVFYLNSSTVFNMMPSPEQRKEQCLATIQVRDCQAAKQLCWKAPGGIGRWWAEHEPAVCPSNRILGWTNIISWSEEQLHLSIQHFFDHKILHPVLGP